MAESTPVEMPVGTDDASGIAYVHSLADKTREVLHIIKKLPTDARTFQSTIGELENELVSEFELKDLVSADLSCFQRQIEGFQDNYLTRIGMMSQLSARFRTRLLQLVAMNDDTMNHSESLHLMVNTTVKPEMWQCMLDLSAEMTRVRSLLDQRRSMYSHPLSVYLGDVTAATDAVANSESTDRAHQANTCIYGSPYDTRGRTPLPEALEYSEVAFGLNAIQCTMIQCFHELAEFWIHLMNCKDDSRLMIVLDRSVKQLLTNVQTLLLPTPMAIQAFQVSTSTSTFSASDHYAFIEQNVSRHVDLWKYHGAHISAYIIEQIKAVLVSFIPPSMHALRLKAIASNQSAFEVHVVAKIAHDLNASGIRMLSTYNEQAYTHTVALLFIEVLFTYTSILEDLIVLRTSVAQCNVIGLHARACMLKIDQRFSTIHRKFTQMWASQFNLGISICNRHNSPPSKSIDELCSTYTQILGKLDALSDVQHLADALPQSVEYPFTSLFTRMATCLQLIRSDAAKDTSS